MTQQPVNPFTPGVGEEPPHRGSHEDAERHLTGMLSVLKQPDLHRARFAYLCGPRGNGKSVLMTWFEKKADAIETRIDRITLDPNDLTERQGLIDSVSQQLATRNDGWDFLKNIQFDASFQLPGVGNVGVAHGPRFSSRNLVAVMTATKTPLCITLDEAHTVPPPPMLKCLLDAVQFAGKSIPVILVLAGTPGLEDVLRASGASYWNRGQMLPIGRLSQAAAVEVVRKPLEKAGFVSDAAAIERLVNETNCYPYFLQLYGKAAFDAVLASGTWHFGSRECEYATANAKTGRTDYYMDRWQEFRQANELNLARAVALTFKAHQNRLTNMQMKALLDELNSERSVAREVFLRHKGYIWRQRGRTLWEPGIPSLMDFMIEQTEVKATN